MPVRSWDEILSINHQAYYYFKYLHRLGEGTCWLPAGEINGVSLLAGTPSLAKNKKRHRSSCSVCCRKCVQIWEAEHRFQRRCKIPRSVLHKSGVVVLFGPARISSEHEKGEATRMLMKCTFWEVCRKKQVSCLIWVTCSMLCGYLHLRWKCRPGGNPGTCDQTACKNILFCFYRCTLFFARPFFFPGGRGGSPSLVFLSKPTGIHVLPSDVKFLLE